MKDSRFSLKIVAEKSFQIPKKNQKSEDRDFLAFLLTEISLWNIW